jgi:predicted O-methyltransferase YrrM
MGMPFAGDTYLAEWFDELNTKHKFIAAIETGTHIGDSTVWFAQKFPHVYTCDNNKDYFEISKNRFINLNNVTSELQTSPTFLYNILSKLPTDKKVFIFLDAHWGKNVLLEELEIICNSNISAVIAIHDFKVPGTNLNYDKYDGTIYEWKSIKKYIEAFNKEYKITYNYKATGACVGCIVIEFE